MLYLSPIRNKREINGESAVSFNLMWVKMEKSAGHLCKLVIVALVLKYENAKKLRVHLYPLELPEEELSKDLPEVQSAQIQNNESDTEEIEVEVDLTV